MTPREALRAGRLEEALAGLQQEVRRAPDEARLRIFLFQLLCVLGQWDRALTQLMVAGELDASALLMVQTYREALRCEVYRAQVFAGRRIPVSIGEPDPWFAPLVQSLALFAANRGEEAAELRSRALAEAPATSGRLNDAPFDWLADGDARLGPCLELIISGRYYWVPMHRIRNLVIEPPADLRDTVWTPVEVQWVNGGETVALIPSRYPGSESAADPALRLGRRTDWREVSTDAYVGLGQRVWISDGGETALLDVRRLEFTGAADGAAET